MSKVYLTCGGSPLVYHFSPAVKSFLVAIIFLSSGAAHGNLSPSGHIVSTSSSLGNPQFHLLRVPRPAPASAFATQHAPVRYVFKWPPVPTRADRLRQEAYLQLIEVMHQEPSQAPVKRTPWWHYIVLAGGLATVLIVGAWSRIKVFN